MEVICLQDEAFYKLVDEVVSQLREKLNVRQEKWIAPERAMELLILKAKQPYKLCEIGATLLIRNRKRKSFFMIMIRL